MVNKKVRRKKIHWRLRKKIKGTEIKPRLSVYRSNKKIYCQLIDDINGVTIASAESSTDSGSKSEQAKATGVKIAEQAKSKNIDTIVFDRGGYLYHGRVKSLADGIREGGIIF